MIPRQRGWIILFSGTLISTFGIDWPHEKSNLHPWPARCREEKRMQIEIELAEKWAHMNDSAKLCLRDAYACIASGREEYAAGRALESLRYSVGVFHPDYRLAAGGAA